MANLLSNTTIGGYQSIHTGNVGSYAITSIPTSFSSITVTSSFDTASNDIYASMRVIRNNAGSADGMYIGYGNSGSGITRIFGGGSTGGALEKYATYTVEPGSFRAPIFYDSADTTYYLDPNSTTSLRTVGSWRSDSSTWDGEYSGKIQYHSNHWYFQSGNLWIFRNAGGSNVFQVDQSGNGTFNGDIYLGTRATWLSSYLNQDVRTSASPSFSTVNLNTLNASDTNARYYVQSTNGVPSNNLGNPTVTEMALFDEQFNNKTAFYDNTALSFWTSSDGTNYTEYTGFDTTTKKRFLGGDSDSGVYIPNLTNRFRIELENTQGYVFLNQLYIYWSSNSHSTKVHIWVRRCDNNQWYQWTDSNTQVSSWPGHLYLPFGGIPFYPGALASNGHYNRIRIEFIPSWSSGTYSYTNINLMRMQIWGGYPAGKRNIYSVDENRNVTFPTEVGATAFYATDFRAANAFYLNGTSYYLNSTNGGIYTNARFETASNLVVQGSSYLGNGNGDEVHINDILRVGATDSGDAHFYFGEGSSAGSDYGSHWYWDSGYTFTWNTRNNGSDTALFDYVTNDTTYLNWRRNFHMQNREINFASQLHFNGGTRFVAGDSNYLTFRPDSTSVGGIQVKDGNSTLRGYSAYFDSSGFGLLNSSGSWGIRLNPGNGDTLLYSGGNWKLTTISAGISVNGNVYTNQNYGDGLVGVYSAERYQGVFAMGDAYKLATNGTSPGSLYGIAWTHTNVGGQSKSGLGHQALFMMNGQTYTAIGSGIWTDGTITTTSHGTSANWIAAYNWGNHASADYLVKGTQILSSASWPTATRFGSVGDISQEAGNHALSVRSENNNDAFMSFHIGGDYAVHFGLDRVSNRMSVGGWSDGAVKYQLWDSRDFTSSNISNWSTAYSWGNHASAGYQSASTAITTSNIGSQSVSYATTAGALTSMNISQFTNNSGYITGYTETDTLASVTGRGASTSTTLNLDGRVNIGNGLTRPSALNSDSVAHARIGGSDVHLYVASLGAGGGYKVAVQAARTSDFASFDLDLQSNGGTLRYGGNEVATRTWVTSQSYLTGITSLQVTNALGYTPYNSTNPSGYITGYTETDTLATVTSRGATTSGNITINGGILNTDLARIINPHGASYTAAPSSITGAWKIKLPAGSKLLYPMLQFTINIYTYSTGVVSQIRVGGHFSDTSWYNIFAYGITDTAPQYTIRFGFDATNALCVWVGELGTAWSYPSVFVTDFQNGYSAVQSSWASGWTITNVTAFDTVTNARSVALGLNTNNYNSYAPTLTGTGASGTWSINVTGNAGSAGGLVVHNNRNNEANKIVRTDANGYIQAGWINTTSGAFSSTINKIYCSDDDYMRYQTPANFISNLGLITTSNIGSQSVSYATTAGSLTSMNISQFTNNSGYITGISFANVSSKPTTISGYGITDAITTANIGSQSVSYAATAGSAPNGSNINSNYDVTAGVGNGLRFWNGSSAYKISMGVGALYQYGPVTDYSIKAQMNDGDATRGFTWGRESHAPIAALNSTSGDMEVAGYYKSYGYRGNGNVGGTGSASWHPDGIYCGSTMWQYGAQYKNNTGIYNVSEMTMNSGPTLSTYNTRNLIVRALDNNADVGILGQKSGGGFAFQIYGTGSSYGFLNGTWASWDIRKAVSGAMYMNDNDSYYLQTNSTSNFYALNIQGNAVVHAGNIGSQSVSYATTAGTANAVAWTNVSSRPTALSQFTNDLGNYGGFLTSITAHSHAISDVTGLQTALDSKQASLGFTPYNSTNPSGYITSSGSISGNAATATTAPSGINRGDQIHGGSGVTPATSFASMPSGMSGFTDNWSGGDLPSGMGHVHGIACRHFNNTSNSWGWHMVGQYDQPGDLRVRWVNAGTWTAYYQLLSSSNYNSYSPTLTGTGASGTWGINVTGSAGSISGFNNPATGATANTIVYRDSSGDIYGRYIFGSYHNSSDNVDTGSITYIMAKFGDNYHRSATAAKVQAFLGLGSLAYSSATIPTNNNQLTNGAGYITGINSGNVTTALGFTPYNATNPSGYITSSASISGNAATATYATTAGSAPANGGNSTTVGGYTPSGSVGANTVVIRDANNYIYAHYINSNVSESENPTINSFYTSNGDGWLRKSSVAHVKSQLGLGSLAYISSLNELDWYGYLTTENWNTYWTSNKLRVASVSGATGTGRPPSSVHNFGSLLSYGTSSGDAFQMYFPDNAGNSIANSRKLHYRTGQSVSAGPTSSGWCDWRTVVDMVGDTLTIVEGSTPKIVVRGSVSYGQPTSASIELVGDADGNQTQSYRWISTAPDWGGQEFRLERKVNNVFQLVGRVPKNTNNLEWQGTITQGLSDSRVKTNVVSMTEGLDKIDQIRPVTFDWVPTENVSDREGADFGFIAQELEEVLPEVVHTRGDGYKTVMYEKVVPVLVQAMKEQQAMIEALRAEIELLKNR